MTWLQSFWQSAQHIILTALGAIGMAVVNYYTSGGSLTDGNGLKAAALGGLVGIGISYIKKLNAQNQDQQAQLDVHNQALQDAKILPPPPKP